MEGSEGQGSMDWEQQLRGHLLPEEVETPEGKAAAVSLILRERGGALELLLIERVDREGDPWSGHIALPGGMRGSEDSTLSETVRRETLEEVDLDVREACIFLGRLEPVRPSNAPQLTVFPFVHSLRKEVNMRSGEEVRSYFWASLRELKDARVTTEVRTFEYELVVPAYLHDGKVVWGLTYRILTAFYDMLEGVLAL